MIGKRGEKSIRKFFKSFSGYLYFSWFLFFFAFFLLFLYLINIMMTSLNQTMLSLKQNFSLNIKHYSRYADMEINPADTSSLFLEIDQNGKVKKASAPMLVGIDLTKGDFYGKIRDLDIGDISLFFYPDFQSSIPQLYFVKRYITGFRAFSIYPNVFFDISIMTTYNISIVDKKGICLFSSIPEWIGDLIQKNIMIFHNELYLLTESNLKEMRSVSLVVGTNFTGQFANMVGVTFLFLAVFAFMNIRVLGFRKSLLTMNEEFVELTSAVGSLSQWKYTGDADFIKKMDDAIRSYSEFINKIKGYPFGFEETDNFSIMFQELVRNIQGLTALSHRDAEILQEREAYLRSVFEAAQNVGFIAMQLDSDQLIVADFSAGAEKIFGYDKREIIGVSALKLYKADQVGMLHNLLIRIQTGYTGEIMELTMLTHSGKEFSALCILHPILTPKLAFNRIISVVVDITELKKAENELLSEKERLAVTLQSIAEGVITTDETGRITLMNSIAQTLTGWNFTEAENRNLDEIFHIVDVDNRIPIESPFRSTFEPIEVAKDALLIAKDGSEKTISLSVAPIRNNDGTMIGTVVVFRDETQNKRMEESILKAQKLESLGVLAGGIAHDFNNLLTAILGNISLLKIITDPHDERFGILAGAETATMRAKELTHQLLTFSKGGEPIKKRGYIQNVIQETVVFILRGSTIKLDFKTDPDLWKVEYDEGQISRVFNNLALNAKEAMRSGGRIEIRIGNRTIEASEVPPLAAGRYVLIEFRDEGKGISGDILPKIFDPYFTTKSLGSGLGLATTYSIIIRHKGFIDVSSEIGKGTCFYIYLPAVGEFSVVPEIPEEAEEVKPVREKKRAAISARILIMDDEYLIRELTKEILTRFGYEVSTVEDGEACLEAYRSSVSERRKYDLVIMDLTIPGGMGGKDAIRELHKIDGKAKGLVSSGYSNDPILSNFREYGFVGSINKPYKVEDLLQKIEDALKEA